MDRASAAKIGANDGRELVGEDAGKKRQVARAVVLRQKPIADGRLALSEAVQVTHRVNYAAADPKHKGDRVCSPTSLLV
jgi:hypothetical protein